MRIRRRRAYIAAFAVLLLSSAGTQLSSAALADSSISAQYLARMNQERGEDGRAALGWRSDLADIAQSWAEHMASTQDLAHNPDLTRQVRNWEVVGENVGVGPTLDDLDHAFMRSAEHRDNILDSAYTEVGIGSVATNGAIWIVIDFRDPLVPSPRPRARATSADDWARGAAVGSPAPKRAPVVAQRRLAALVMRAELFFAPGCMLRWGAWW